MTNPSDTFNQDVMKEPFLPVMEPVLDGNELEYVTDCIRSGWISSKGAYVQRFEKKFSELHNNRYAISTSNCTTALHLALIALGIGEGDEVIVPDLTFAATANAVIYTGAKPVLIDVSPEHWCMNPDLIEKAVTPCTRAVIPVHLYGHPCDMDEIIGIAEKHNLMIVEDCAEALDAQYKTQLVGTFGHISCFSFFSNKMITTGEGGMVVTSDPELWEMMKILRDHGMNPNKRYWHDRVGYNYRMTNLQAAIGLAQLERIGIILDARQKIDSMYREVLQKMPWLHFQPVMPWAKCALWLFSVLIDEKCQLSRDKIMAILSEKNIETRPLFYPLHRQPPYACQKDFPVSDDLSSRGFSLPSCSKLSMADIERIGTVLKKI